MKETAQAGPVDCRLLGAGDERVLDRVAPDVFDHAVDPAQARAFLRAPGHLIVVALDRGTVVAMATGAVLLHPDKPPQLFVNEVGTDPAWRRRGLARRLLALLLARGRELGCTAAWVATEAGNREARALYVDAGGTEDAEQAVVFNFRLGAPPAD